MEEKHKPIKRTKHHRTRIGRKANPNFLRRKRAMPYLKAKNKTKIKNWKKQMEELEQNVDFDIVKDNFRHFFHLNLEDSVFDRELGNLGHLFSPIVYWFLINDSYFQNKTIKERINNLINELSLIKNNNDYENVLVLNEESESNAKLISKKGYKYNAILSEPQEAKIKTDFFKHVKSVMNHLKTKDKLHKDNYNNDNDNIIPLEDAKEFINNLIKKVHELNEKKVKFLDKMINNNIANDNKYKIYENNNEMNISNKSNSYIKISPLFEQDNESILISNKFIDYLCKKEKRKFQGFEENKKIFSFSEKFINLKNNKYNNKIENIIDHNNDINEKNDNKDNMKFDDEKKEEEKKEEEEKNELNLSNDNETKEKENEIIINDDDNNNNKNQENFDLINFNNNSENNLKIDNEESNNNTNLNKIQEDGNNINNDHSNDSKNNIDINHIDNNDNITNDNIIDVKENDEDNNKNDNNYNNLIKNDNDKDMIINRTIDSPIAYIKSYLVNKEENYNLINQGICCICNNGEWEQDQLLLRCEQCHVIVHQNCYGAQVKEIYNWVCDACKEMPKEEVYNLECLLCPVLGGAFKKIELPIQSTFYQKIMDYKHNKIQLPKNNYNIIIPKSDYKNIPFAWVHLSCALWNPNINLKNYEKKTGIFLQNITYENFNSYCDLCKKDNCGPTIKCNNDSCSISYHPECARINNCCLEVEVINKEYQYNVYCYKHKPNLLAKRINYNCQNEIQQVITVNQELNNIYDLYKKVYKNDLYQKAKVINQIEIFADKNHLLKHKRHKSNSHLIKIKNASPSSIIKKYNKIKHGKSLQNIVINLSPNKNLSKRGRKKKFFKNIKNANTYYSNSKSNKITKNKKQKKCLENSKNLKSIKIENYNVFNNTIINNIGYGNNINIYVSNYNNVPKYRSIINNNNSQMKGKSENKKYSKDFNVNNLPTPTIEINKKEFDKITNNNSFDVDEYIKDKKEYIVYLIGFLNDYTLNNRIIIKKNNTKNNDIYHSIDKKAPIYYLKYDDFQNSNIPWEEIGYKNLASAILRKAFFAIIKDEKEYKKLFLDNIRKTLKDLKKNKNYEKFTIECDNKEKCIGAPMGVYNLLSLNSFKYKILDEKHFFPKTFLCPSCLNNTPKYKNIQKSQKKRYD